MTTHTSNGGSKTPNPVRSSRTPAPVKKGLRTPQPVKKEAKQVNSILGPTAAPYGSSAVNKKYIPYRPSAGYSQKMLYDERGRPRAPQTPHQGRGDRSRSRPREAAGSKTPRIQKSKRQMELEKMLREEQAKVRAAHKQKFFNADDAYKRLNRRPTLQEKSGKFKGITGLFKGSKEEKPGGCKSSSRPIDPYMSLNPDKDPYDPYDDMFDARSMKSVKSTKSYFDDTKSMKSVKSMGGRSVYSVVSRGNLGNMQKMSASINNLEPQIIRDSKLDKGPGLMFKIFPSCCHGVLVKIFKKGAQREKNYNYEAQSMYGYDNRDMDARSVLTRHLDEIEDLSDVETVYDRRQKEGKPPKTPLNPDYQQRRKKYATLEVRKCKSVAAQLSNDSSSSKDSGYSNNSNDALIKTTHNNKKKVNKVKSKAAKKMTLEMEKSINSLAGGLDDIKEGEEGYDEENNISQKGRGSQSNSLKQFMPDRKSLRALELEMLSRDAHKRSEKRKQERGNLDDGDAKSTTSGYDSNDDWNEAL